MCGIAAVLDRSGRWVEQPELLRMTDAMRHRGPDDEGWYAGHGVGLGNRRLAIIDLTAGGHQPMSNEDGSVWITYNGMLYNYRELRRELVAAGHRFRSASDTEVIVHAYEEWGDDCLQRFDGMFAFAIWDARKRRLMAARDRFGVKPLYWSEHDGRLRAGLGAQGRARGRRAAPRRRPGGRRVLHVPEPLLRPHAVRRRARAPGRLPARGRRRRRRGAALVGLRVRPRRLALARADWGGDVREALEAAVDRQLDRRRPGRQLPLGRPRLRLARRARLAAGAAPDDVHGRLRPHLRRGPRARLRRARRRPSRSRAASARSTTRWSCTRATWPGRCPT